MALWQRTMIRIACNETVKSVIQGRRWLAGLAGRFVAGPDLDSALDAAERLREDGRATSLFYLGEYVEDTVQVADAVRQLEQAAPALAAQGFDVHLSLDPTQAGLMFSEDLCERNVRSVAGAVASSGGVLMIDMEDSSVTQFTLDLHDRLRAEGLPVAVTVQACLHRSAADLSRLAAAGAWVRLVKGALGEPATTAAVRREVVAARYRAGIATLMSPAAREAGCRPSIATHDLRMIVEAAAVARRHGWRAEEFEFEMLYGVRPDLQRELARRGYQLRVYLPFGIDWFPYAVRRVGESPRNLRFALSAVVR